VDNRREFGHAFELFQRAQRFLRDHLPVAGRIVPGLFERVDDPLYPPVALREALANAFCHRDYGAIGGSVGVAIYDDRLEISSTGPLRFGLTPEQLSMPHASQPWNPSIANVFYLRGLIEGWGRGTLKINELAHRAGLVRPEFSERAGEVVVRFFPGAYVPPARVSYDLTELQRSILAALADGGPASTAALQQRVGGAYSNSAILKNLQHLHTLRLVEKTGVTRGVLWRLN
jgi:ATP-dependent DNA helicase RecG